MNDEPMKRFTETNRWRDPWFRKLSPPAKHLHDYLWDNCDCAGVIPVDLEAITFHVGQPIQEQHLAELGDWLERLPDGRYLIPSFIHFQCGTLSADCRGHTSVIKAVAVHGLIAHGIHYHHKSHSLSPSPEQTLLESEKEKESESEKDQDPKGRKIPPALEAVKLHAATIGLPESEAVKFHAYYESNGWRVGKNPMKSWHAAMINWRGNVKDRNGTHTPALAHKPVLKIRSL